MEIKYCVFRGQAPKWWIKPSTPTIFLNHLSFDSSNSYQERFHSFHTFRLRDQFIRPLMSLVRTVWNVVVIRVNFKFLQISYFIVKWIRVWRADEIRSNSIFPPGNEMDALPSTQTTSGWSKSSKVAAHRLERDSNPRRFACAARLYCYATSSLNLQNKNK